MGVEELTGLRMPVMVKMVDKERGGRKQGVPAMLMEVRKGKGLVKPKNHRRAEWRPLEHMAVWKSRAVADSQRVMNLAAARARGV